MVNHKHEEIVKLGVDAINKWHGENPTSRLDLECSNLSGIDLSNADLSNAFLNNAVFKEAKMANAKLIGVNCWNEIFLILIYQMLI